MDAAAVVLCVGDGSDHLFYGVSDLCAKMRRAVCKCPREIDQNWLLSSWRKPGGTRAPVCGERTAWRVPDLGKVMCQKSVLGEEKVTPTKRRSRFSRREVTWHSAD